ncbi:ABC transporter substrate-binding protein, partial [Acinetobacter baumannii]
ALVALLALGVGFAAPAMAASPQAATGFIKTLGAEAISVLADKSKTQADREAAFRTLFTQSFDIDAISQFVLGRYWRTATEAQR